MATRVGGGRAPRRFIAAAVAGVSLGMTGAASAQHKHQSWITAFGGKISDTELMKAVRDRLGGSYQDLQMMFSVCSSEGFSREAERLINTSGDYSVATSRSFEKIERWDIGDDQVRNGKTGLTLRADPGLYMHGWYAQYFRGIQGDANRTAQQLQEFAVANDYRGPNNGSRIVGTDAGRAAKIGDGAQGRQAAMWHTFGNSLQIKKIDEILRANGYTNATIDWAYADEGGNMVEGVPIDRDGDRDTMFGDTGVIENMRTYLRAQMGQRKAFFSISAHGVYGDRKAELKENPQPMQPRQGKQYTPGSGMSLEIDTTDEDLFRRSFFEGFLTDDPELESLAGDRPMFLVTTSEEDYSGPVQVLCDGVDIGSFSMLGLPDGSSYRFNLSDAAWIGLFDAHALDDALLNFTFLFGDGSFRVGTEWDQMLLDLDNFGVQLVGLGVIEVASPGAAGLLGLAGVATTRRRRPGPVSP